MTNVPFLTLNEVLEIHRDQMARYGGTPEVRDLGLLQSALAQPQATFAGRFLHRDVFEMAAAYLFHIVRNHPFVDGNKRVGMVAAIVFLQMNDTKISASARKLESLVRAVADGTADKVTIASFFRLHAHDSMDDLVASTASDRSN